MQYIYIIYDTVQNNRYISLKWCIITWHRNTVWSQFYQFGSTLCQDVADFIASVQCGEGGGYSFSEGAIRHRAITPSALLQARFKMTILSCFVVLHRVFYSRRVTGPKRECYHVLQNSILMWNWSEKLSSEVVFPRYFLSDQSTSERGLPSCMESDTWHTR